MKRWLAIAPLVVLAALAAVFVLQLSSGKKSTQYEPTATVGKAMPDAVLPALADRAPVRLNTQAPPGTLVNFFASWCGPCIEEAPTLMALKAQGVRIVGVAWKDDPEKTKAMLARYGNPYVTVLVDQPGNTGLDFGVTGVPETYVIGPGGRIVTKEAQPLTASSAQRLLEAADGAR